MSSAKLEGVIGYIGRLLWLLTLKIFFDGDPTQAQPQLLKPNNRELIQQYNYLSCLGKPCKLYYTNKIHTDKYDKPIHSAEN